MKGDGALGWGEHHPYLFEGTQELFRPAYDHQLVQHWLPQPQNGIADLETGITVADIGCGTGYSTITLARAFPDSTFIGFDLHQPSIDEARHNASEQASLMCHSKSQPQTQPQGRSTSSASLIACTTWGTPSASLATASTNFQTVDQSSWWNHLRCKREPKITTSVPHRDTRMSLFCCVPCSLSQPGARGMGCQAGEVGMRAVFAEAGLNDFTRIAESPNHIVYEAQPS